MILQAIILAVSLHREDTTVLGRKFGVADLKDLIRKYLFLRANPDVDPSRAVPIRECPEFEGVRIKVYSSAMSTFCAPSDPSGMTGLRREFIRATSQWRGRKTRFDTVFVSKRNGLQGILGMEIARVRLFLSFKIGKEVHSCAAVHWYGRTDDEPDDDTGMWIVKPRYHGRRNRSPLCSVIDVHTVIRAAHLVGVTLDERVSQGLLSEQALDVFKTFFVNKYIDHHAFELLHM